MLDIECFTYLNARLESSMAPTVILATNRGNSLVRGTTYIVAPHGIPVIGAVLISIQRCLIVKTDAYSKEQTGKVMQLRGDVEEIKLSLAIAEQLSVVGEKSSLR